MGEAKRRGTYEQRVALAKDVAAERDKEIKERQREQAEQRRQADAIRPKASPKLLRTIGTLAAFAAVSGVSMWSDE